MRHRTHEMGTPAATPYDPIATGERALASAPLTVRAARASGPGGQHVNTTDSAVTISVAVDDLTLDESQRAQLPQRLRTAHQRRRSAGGELPGRAQPAPEPAHRARAPGAHDRRGRQPEHCRAGRRRPGRAAVERRLDEKRQISARKRARARTRRRRLSTVCIAHLTASAGSA